MSMFIEQPFNEHEERAVLAEILKASALPSSTLLKFIKGYGIEPQWSEIPLPTGRSVSACQKAYDTLLTSLTPSPITFPSFAIDPDTKVKRTKRPLSMGEGSERNVIHSIQPRPPAFVTVNGQEQFASERSDDRPRKKRGRPNKAEHELRVAQAAARGEVYPRPRKPKTPRPSMEGTGLEGTAAPVAIMLTPNVPGDVPVAESPPSADQKEPPTNPQEYATKLSIQEVASAAEQIHEEAQRAAEGIIPETQVSEISEKQSLLLAEMQEAAARGPDQDVQMGETEAIQGGET